MRIAIALCVALAAGPALANDSTAELATGGLRFLNSPTIEMQSEDVYVSPSAIRVTYRFVNTSPKDVTTLVAFPVPEITVSGPDDNIALPTDNPDNILDFHTTADGKPVAMEVEQKVLALGLDRTELLRKLGIPLAPQLAATREALDRLPRGQWDELVKLGLAEVEEYDVGKGMQQHLEPRWTLKTTYYWEQTFPGGGSLVIEHRYKPSVGTSVGTSLGQDWAKKEDWYSDYQRKYCLDASFLSTVARATKAAEKAQAIAYSEERIEYILKTGANWDGPIKDFRLVVDKGDPSNLISFCGDGVKKISPTQFEVHKSDFTPKDDLYVLILTRPPR